MRTRRAGQICLAALLAFLGLVAFAPPATAGGPTSVLLVNSTTEQARGLYTTDPLYTELGEAIDIFGKKKTQTEQPPDATSGGPGTRAITMTWMIHNVSVWRIDYVHLDNGSVAWIETRENPPETSIWKVDPVWHRPANPEHLTKLLDALGLIHPNQLTKPSAPTTSAGQSAQELTSTDNSAQAAGGFPGATFGNPSGWILLSGAIGLTLGATAPWLLRTVKTARKDRINTVGR